METQEQTPGKFSVNYGLILGAIMILISVIQYVTGMALEGTNWPTYLYYIIFPAVIIYAISVYKKNNNGFLTLSNAIKIGLIIAIISALVNIVYGIVFNYFIDPEFTGKIIEMTGEKLLENPNVTPEMVETQMEMMEKFQNPIFGFTIWLALSAFFGLVYSLIGGLIMKKEEE